MKRYLISDHSVIFKYVAGFSDKSIRYLIGILDLYTLLLEKKKKKGYNPENLVFRG